MSDPSVPRPRSEHATVLTGPDGDADAFGQVEVVADRVAERVIALREEFDHAFTDPVVLEKPSRVDVLTFKVGGESCAVRLSEVAEVSVRPALTPVPARSPALLGLAATRGRVVAAFDLSVLLGGSRTEPRWLLVPVEEPTIGLTFEHFEGHRQLVAGTPQPAARVIPMATLVAAVRALSPQTADPGERS